MSTNRAPVLTDTEPTAAGSPPPPTPSRPLWQRKSEFVAILIGLVFTIGSVISPMDLGQSGSPVSQDPVAAAVVRGASNATVARTFSGISDVGFAHDAVFVRSTSDVIRDSFRVVRPTLAADRSVGRRPSSIVTSAAKVVSPAAKPAKTVTKPAKTVTKPAKTVTRVAKPAVRKAAAAPKPATVRRGTNHLWIPALGLTQRIYRWGCHPGTLPNRVYVWTCTGRNNLVLLGHAYGVFSRIHNYYAAHKRMPSRAYVLYANSKGVVQRYNLAWARVITDASLLGGRDRSILTASLSRPTITLITCIGSGAPKRLVTRWVLAR